MTSKTKQCGKHVYHSDNCEAVVRKTVINKYGDIFMLVGQHAFQWSVITDIKGKLTKTTFQNRKSAIKEFNKISK